MDNTNIFDVSFDRVSESRQHVEEIRAKTIQGVIDLNEARKLYASKQKVLTQTEVETSGLRRANLDLKKLLMQVLIEKEELAHRKSALKSNIEKIETHIQELERETDMFLLN